MEVPFREISPSALRGVIESFILREGTDYGEREHTIDEKVSAVKRQLEQGKVSIVYDEETETCSIIVKN